MRDYVVAVVGIGAVGTEMIRVLRERQFPAKEIRVLARRARAEEGEACRGDEHKRESPRFTKAIFNMGEERQDGIRRE